MGRDNVVVDALSRKMEEMVVPLQEGQIMLITFPNPTWVEDIKDSYLIRKMIYKI
jgi:hypothetical protein